MKMKTDGNEGGKSKTPELGFSSDCFECFQQMLSVTNCNISADVDISDGLIPATCLSMNQLVHI